jgi:hypothetical protein
VRAARLSLIVLLGIALLAGGTLPSEHLHHSTATHAQVVHAHFEYALASDHDHHAALEVGDDDRENAVDLECVIAGGPRPSSAGPPAVPSAGLPLPVPTFGVGTVSRPKPSPTASPPRRSLAPRAPPA